MGLLLDYYFVLRALHIEQGSLADRTHLSCGGIKDYGHNLLLKCYSTVHGITVQVKTSAVIKDYPIRNRKVL